MESKQQIKSRCCGARLLSGVQCKACGADDRKFIQEVKFQHKILEVCGECFHPQLDMTNIKSVLTTGHCVKCLSKEHIKGDQQNGI